MENGKWKMENGKWKMENGKWKMENGKWKMENGKYLFNFTMPSTPVSSKIFFIKNFSLLFYYYIYIIKSGYKKQLE